jgi:PadR family transcriptional regulator PadR
VAQSTFLRNWESQARKGSLELVVMSALSRQEYYGYELVEHLHSACRLDVKDGTLYAILIRLQKEGLVQHRWEHMASGPARKYYSLTKAGVSALSSMRALWLDIARAVETTRGRK